MSYEFTFHNDFLGIQVGSNFVEESGSSSSSSGKDKNARGILVTRLFPRADGELSAAQTSGIITPGDRILKINGESVCDMPFKEAREILEGAGRPCTIVFEGAQTVSPSRKSKIKSKFRNSKKSQILREIHNLSMILRTEKSPKFNSVRERLNSLEGQIAAFTKTLEVVSAEIKNSTSEYERIKKQTGEAFEKLRNQVTPLLAQKKLLVKEVHAQRRDLQHKKRDADLYKHAVIGVEKEIERIRQEQIVATGRDGEIERAIQKSVYSVVQKREELKETVNFLTRIFDTYDEAFNSVSRITKIWNSGSTKDSQDNRTSMTGLKSFFRRGGNKPEISGSGNQADSSQEIDTIVQRMCDKVNLCNDISRYLDKTKGILNTAESVSLPVTRVYQSNVNGEHDDSKNIELSNTIELLNLAASILKDSAAHVMKYCEKRMRNKKPEEYIAALSERLLQVSKLDGLSSLSSTKLQGASRTIQLGYSQKRGW